MHDRPMPIMHIMSITMDSRGVGALPLGSWRSSENQDQDDDDGDDQRDDGNGSCVHGGVLLGIVAGCLSVAPGRRCGLLSKPAGDSLVPWRRPPARRAPRSSSFGMPPRSSPGSP